MMHWVRHLPLLLLVLLAGCHALVPYDPSSDGGSGDGPKRPDLKFDGLKLEGPVTSLDGGSCQQGILHSDFASKPADWLPKDALCGHGKDELTDCGTPCWHVSDSYLEKEFSPSSLKQFTLGLRFKMVKAPACEVVLFRLGSNVQKESDLGYGLRLVIGRTTGGAPELQLHTRSKVSWGPRDARLVQIKESTWYSVELRGRAGSWQIYLISGVVTGDDGTTKHWNDWSTYQYFNSLKSYQFGALTRDCCKPQIDYDWVCFLNTF